MIVAFNSMDSGSEVSLNNMIASALALTQSREERIVLLQGEFGNYRIQEAVMGWKEQLVREPYAYMDGVGMDFLIKRSQYDMLDEQNVSEGIIYVRDNLAYVPGVLRKNRAGYEHEFQKECPNILRQLEKVADYVFVDCANVLPEAGRKIQEQADLVIMNLVQSKRVLDDYFMVPAAFPYRYKSMFCIGNYVKEEPCNVKNIQRLYRIEDQYMGIIPYNAEFLSSLKRGKAVHFFENRFVRSKYFGNQEFFHAAFQVADSIMSWEERQYGGQRQDKQKEACGDN